MPVYNTAAYEFESAEAMEAAFCGRTSDHAYSRITNPTVQYFEDRVQSVTGAMSVTAPQFRYGCHLQYVDDDRACKANIVTSPHLFGNTWSLMKTTLATLDIEARFCNLTDPDEDPRLYRLQHLCDLSRSDYQSAAGSGRPEDVIFYRKGGGVPLIADTTIVPFSVFHGKDFGIDIEIVSSTKYISGGATSIGGLILDNGTFDWSHFITLKHWYEQFGERAFTARLRKEIHRNLGAYMTPQVAYMQNAGTGNYASPFRTAGSNLPGTSRPAANAGRYCVGQLHRPER